MTTATSLRPREFTVSENTSSKEFYEQLSSLNTSNSSDQPVPVRAYESENKEETRIVIHQKQKGLTQKKLMDVLDEGKVPARKLVIEIIEKILTKESEKMNSTADKELINQVLKNIKKIKFKCSMHDVKASTLINDLSKLQPVWDKSSTTKNNKASAILKPNDTHALKKIAPQNESNVKKSTATKITKEKKIPTSDKTKATNLIQNQKTPNLKITKEAFDLSTAINFLESVKKHNHSLSLESSSKASLRAGLKKTGEFSFYVSKDDDAKSKKNSRKAEGRQAENKNITAKRAIAMIQTLANSLVAQKRLSADEVKTVFSPIEKQKFIDMNDISSLLNLLEKGRRATIPNNSATTTADANPVTPQKINFNNNPFDVTPTELSTPKAAPALPPTASAISFKEITTPENQPSATYKPIPSTNPFEDVPTTENATTALPAPPNFFQRVSNFFKPVTNFFASVRRFFGFN